MQLTQTPEFLGGDKFHIGVNSPYHINATNMNATRFECYLYMWSGLREISTPIDPLQVISKEVLNKHSFYFNISDYIRPYITPVIYEQQNFDEYQSDYKWVCWTIKFYRKENGIEQLVSTRQDYLHFASYGFSWNDYTRNLSIWDSNSNIYSMYNGGDKYYKINYMPVQKNDNCAIYHNFTFTADTDDTADLCRYYKFTENELIDDTCGNDYNICFMNRFGAFEYFPLKGIVRQSTQVTKNHFKSHVPNWNYLELKNYKPELTSTSINKYNWSSVPLDEMFYLKIEEIIHSPLLFIHKLGEKDYMEQVIIPSINYTRRNYRNDKSKQTYNIEFVGVMNKKK